IVSYIYDKRHADFLSDFIIQMSQNSKLYARESTVIIVTSDVSLFPSIVQKFCIVVSAFPTEKEREELVKSIISVVSNKIPIVLSNSIQEIVQNTKGLTLHDIESVMLKSVFEKQTIDLQYFTNFKIELLRKIGLSYIIPQYGFEAIGGYDYLKEYMKNNVISILKDPSGAQELGLSIPRGMILFGPPGTGKTFFAKAMAKEIGLPMITLNPSDFFRSLVGETEQRVKMLTSVIESLAPIIVFIDEIDQIAFSREKMISTDSGVSRRFINMILEWLGDFQRKSFVIGATNYISDIDTAFIRPGRIDDVLVVFPPDFQARLQILQVHTNIIRKIPLSEDVNFQEIAKKTTLWTGAELEKLVLSAARNAFVNQRKKVTQSDFEAAFNSIEINYAERERTLQRIINEARRLENIDKRMFANAISMLKNDSSLDERIKSILK
ncbi:MAG: ATP-binding protein, partial [Thermoprotei archaeon]